MKDMKKLFMATSFILVLLIATGQIGVYLIAGEYKEKMITHDYALAGYLSEKDFNKTEIPAAFTAEKTAVNIAAGQAMLQMAGYEYSTNNDFLPEVSNFYRKYAVWVLLTSVIFSLAVLAILAIHGASQDRKLNKAHSDILSFLDGKQDTRLEDHAEGSLSRVFSAVNAMATSLTAHITKEKQNKEFLKDTISDISHQLKTPLSALKMYNEIITEEDCGNNVVDNFTYKSITELERMENLIQNLLKLARLDAGAIELDKKEHCLQETLQTIRNRFLTRSVQENKIIDLDCDQRVSLNYDQEWLIEALSNILKNALEHINTGQAIRIFVTETPVLVRITIQDNGQGIHPEDIHAIFKRFYRSRYSKDRQGIGIGLSLAKSIIDKHGGSIMVESELGKGTAFHMVFPKLTNL